MKQEDLAWFAGFIDGEGTISVNQQDIKRGPFLQAKVTISNTNVPTLRHLEELLQNSELPFYVDWKTNASNFGERKPLWRITFAGLKRVNKILSLVVPYLVTKREQGELTLKFVKSRLNINSEKGSRNPYSEEEIKTASAVRELNRKSHH